METHDAAHYVLTKKNRETTDFHSNADILSVIGIEVEIVPATVETDKKAIGGPEHDGRLAAHLMACPGQIVGAEAIFERDDALVYEDQFVDPVTELCGEAAERRIVHGRPAVCWLFLSIEDEVVLKFLCSFLPEDVAR